MGNIIRTVAGYVAEIRKPGGEGSQGTGREAGGLYWKCVWFHDQSFNQRGDRVALNHVPVCRLFGGRERGPRQGLVDKGLFFDLEQVSYDKCV